MTRVLYTPDIFSLQKVGGVSRYFVELIKRVDRSDCSPQVVAGLHKNSYLRKVARTNGVYLPRLGPLLGPRRLQLNQSLFKFVAKRHPGAVIHQTYYTGSKYPSSHPVVLTVLDMIEQLFPELPTSVPHDQKRANCKRAQHIIAISQVTKQDIVRLFGVAPEKITVIYLADSLPQGLNEPQTPLEEPPYLLFVGMRNYYKNFNRLVQAYASSSSLKQNFRILAFGGGQFSEKESQLLKTLNVESKVSQVSGDDHKLAGYYREASALVYPSLYRRLRSSHSGGDGTRLPGNMFAISVHSGNCRQRCGLFQRRT